jgi:hypothetical protein
LPWEIVLQLVQEVGWSRFERRGELAGMGRNVDPYDFNNRQ